MDRLSTKILDNMTKAQLLLLINELYDYIESIPTKHNTGGKIVTSEKVKKWVDFQNRTRAEAK